MLFGHVDKVSRRGIEGWAADDMRPDDAIDVSIFIGGRKVAQLVWDRPREDLLRTGQYGNGRHGFSYRFPKSVVQSVEARVSIRFSSSGSPLTGGDCTLDGSGVRVIPPAAPLAEDEPVMLQDPRGRGP